MLYKLINEKINLVGKDRMFYDTKQNIFIKLIDFIKKKIDIH